jgi:hypothetical protein
MVRLNGAVITFHQCPADGRHARHDLQPQHSLDQGIVLIELHIAQFAETQKQVHDEHLHNDGRTIQVPFSQMRAGFADAFFQIQRAE